MENIGEKIGHFEDRAPETRVVVPEPCEVVAGTTPADLLAVAVNQGADLAKLEKLMDLQERWEANEARKAYTRAMAAFKENPPEILKDASVSYQAGGGTTEYSHATLGAVTSVIGAALSQHGLSVAWKTAQNGDVIVTCVITHEQGHSESTSLSAKADTSGSKNAIQAIGSTITYLQRYTLLSLTGLAAKGQDDDGRGSDPVEYITDEQSANLDALRTEVGADGPKFLKRFGIETLSELPVKQYENAVKVLEGKR